MAVQRKCPSCGKWNYDEDYCVSCEAVLSPKLIEKEKEKKRQERRDQEKPSQLDVVIDKWKNSKCWILRVSYQVLYTVGMLFFSIAAFFAWLVTGAYG